LGSYHTIKTWRWKLIEIHVACDYTEPLDLWYIRSCSNILGLKRIHYLSTMVSQVKRISNNDQIKCCASDTSILDLQINMTEQWTKSYCAGNAQSNSKLNSTTDKITHADILNMYMYHSNVNLKCYFCVTLNVEYKLSYLSICESTNVVHNVWQIFLDTNLAIARNMNYYRLSL
jgi:hypothetical protein